MDQGQEMFFNFILEKVQEGKQDEAKALLEESFAKMAGGDIDQDYLKTFAMNLVTLLNPESIPEVVSIMENFAKSYGAEE